MLRPVGILCQLFMSVALVCLTLSTLDAQSTIKIVGRVVDAETKVPLVGATILVEGTGYGAFTDERGFYSIENLFAGEYSLRARFVGYETQHTKTVVVRRETIAAVNFELRRIFLPVDEIVAEGVGSQLETSNFVKRLTVEEIEKSNAHTVGELLEHVSGVDIIDEGGGSGRKRISIRGSRSNHVIVVVDGVSLSDPLTGDVDLSLIPLSMVKEVRITKSGGSHLYGSGALGGVIDIVTRSNSLNDVRCKLTCGNFQAWGINPGCSGRWKEFSFFGQYDHMKDGGRYVFETVKGDSEIVQTRRRNADFSDHNLFGTVAFQRGGHEVTFKANLYDSERGLPGLIFALTPHARAETDRRIFILDHRFEGRTWHWRGHLSRHENDTEYRHLPPIDAPLEDRSQPPYQNLYALTSHQGGIRFDWNPSKVLKFGCNATLRRDELEDRDLLGPGTSGVGRALNNSRGFGLHSEARFGLPLSGTRGSLSSSLRYDAIDFKNGGTARTEEEFSPHLGLHISRNQGYALALEANWGQSFRAPTLADLFYQDFRVRGNPDVKAESSVNIDVGVRLGVPVYGWFELEGGYFRRDIDDLIVWRMGSFATFSPFNTDALISGWEFCGNWHPWKDRLNMSLSHVVLEPLNKSGERTTHDRVLPYQAERTTKIGVGLDLGAFSIDYRRRMIGERFVTEANTVRMEPYVADDISALFSTGVMGGDIRFKVSVLNLWDEEYEMIERAPLPGRHWRGSMEARF